MAPTGSRPSARLGGASSTSEIRSTAPRLRWNTLRIHPIAIVGHASEAR